MKTPDIINSSLQVPEIIIRCLQELKQKKSIDKLPLSIKARTIFQISNSFRKLLIRTDPPFDVNHIANESDWSSELDQLIIDLVYLVRKSQEIELKSTPESQPAEERFRTLLSGTVSPLEPNLLTAKDYRRLSAVHVNYGLFAMLCVQILYLTRGYDAWNTYIACQLIKTQIALVLTKDNHKTKFTVSPKQNYPEGLIKSTAKIITDPTSGYLSTFAVWKHEFNKRCKNLGE